jgi:hypothetical protein
MSGSGKGEEKKKSKAAENASVRGYSMVKGTERASTGIGRLVMYLTTLHLPGAILFLWSVSWTAHHNFNFDFHSSPIC